MHRYYDLNGDTGGFLKKDELWWYGSLRQQNIQTLLPNFPVKPFETGLKNVSAKATYAINAKNKLIAYGMWGQKYQPNRLDTYLIPATTAIHNSVDSTLLQQVLGTHLQRRVGQRSVRPHVLRGARRAVRLRLAVSPQQQRAPPSRSQHQRRQRRQPGRLVDQPAAESALRDVEHLQGRVGRRPQLQDGRRNLQREHRVQARRRRRRQPAGGRAAGAEEWRAVGGAAVSIAGRFARRPADVRPLHHRHVARERQADAQPRCAVRSLSLVPARAGRPADQHVQPRSAGFVRRERQPHDVEPAGAAAGLHLRSAGQRQDRD